MSHNNKTTGIIKIGNVILLGTSHVAEESKEEVKRIVDSEEPTMIGLELDIDRLQGLMERIKTPGNRMKDKAGKRSKNYLRGVGFSGFLFAKIASFIQERIASKLGVEPGVEMEAALKIALEKRINIVLLDQNIKKTLRDFSRKVPLTEKLRLILDPIILPITLPIISIFNKKVRKEARVLMSKKEIDLRRVPNNKLVDEVLVLMKQRYPMTYKVLVEDRNKVIVNNIMNIMKKMEGDDKLLCVLGAGHINGVVKELNKRLKHEGSSQRRSSQGLTSQESKDDSYANSSYSYSFTYPYSH